MALDRGVVLPGLDEGFGGSAPDLGALELGCAAPVYGPRPIGTEENEAPIDCTITPAAADAGISVDAGGSPEAGPGGAPPNDNGAPSDGTAAPGSSGNSSSSGCGCRSTQGSSAVFPLGALVALAFVGRLRRARRRAPTSGD
jgi:MYXO-CTERM domain-containing protein